MALVRRSLRIAAVVVLYNPTSSHIKNMDGYNQSVEKVYAIDNSEQPDPAIVAQLSGLPNVEYIANHGNLGIAKALNLGAELAIAAGFDLLLTMDQDSEVLPGMVERLLACIDTVDSDMLGIVSPCHQLGETFSPPTKEWQELEVTMTSGNLLNLTAFKAIGPFREDYFIDYVDYEYCLRLREHGFFIIQANRALLLHRLGVMTWRRFLHKALKLGNHPPIRRYYSFRNRFYLHQQYKKVFPGCFRYFYREIIQEIGAVLLFEKQKFDKLQMMWRGFLDYRKGIFGKYVVRS